MATDLPDHLDYLLRSRHVRAVYTPAANRYSMNRAEPVVLVHRPDELDLHGPRWGPSTSVYRAGRAKPYVGVPLDENGFIEANKPFYRATSGAVLVVVPPPAGTFVTQAESDVFDPVNGERIGKVPTGGYRVEVVSQGEPTSGDLTTDTGTQEPTTDVAPPAPMNAWEWLKQPIHPKVKIPRGLVLALAGLGIGYYATK